jgi:hypothetical protein
MNLFGLTYNPTLFLGQHTQKDDKIDNSTAHIIPWSKLKGTVKRCCNEACGFSDIKKLCCDGDEFRKTEK